MTRLYLYDIGTTETKVIVGDADSNSPEEVGEFVKDSVAATIDSGENFGGFLWAFFSADIEEEITDYQFDVYVEDQLATHSLYI